MFNIYLIGILPAFILTFAYNYRAVQRYPRVVPVPTVWTAVTSSIAATSWPITAVGLLLYAAALSLPSVRRARRERITVQDAVFRAFD